MCIEEVKAWSFAGKHYTTELAAITAAIDEIGERLVSSYKGRIGAGLLTYPDLPRLLTRHAELTAEAKAAPAGESTEGTRAEKLEGTRAVEDGMVTMKGPDA